MRPKNLFGVSADMPLSPTIDEDSPSLLEELERISQGPSGRSLQSIMFGTHLRASGALGVPQSRSNPAAFRLYDI